jgi:hypothetical protein
LNAGEICRLALARIDLAKLRIAAEQQPNLLPHILGPCIVQLGDEDCAEAAEPLRRAWRTATPIGVLFAPRRSARGCVLQRRRPKTVVDLSQN